MSLRPYQSEALDAIEREFETKRSTLLVMATGCGKTQIFTHLCREAKSLGRCLILAHTSELIEQAARKVREITGEDPEIEMADRWADQDGFLAMGRAPIIVSSVQTQIAPWKGRKRMHRFDPREFARIIIDEADRALANSYREIARHYMQNESACLLGVTATPDRSDRKAMGQVFESVAYKYDILEAMRDGWLVPIRQQSVMVKELDFSEVRTTAGDLNERDLAEVMEQEEALHRIASPIIEIAGNRRTLVFAASVKQAERLTEILDRHRTGCAAFVCGKTPRDLRRKHIADFASGAIQFLVNVGVFTTGFDDPGIEMIAMARPTKSSVLYRQMIGRGTRPLPGTVDGLESAQDRRAAIAASSKPALLVLDFVGNAGKHKLVTVADILGGKRSPEVVASAKKKAEKEGGARDVEELLEEAEQEAIDAAKAKEREERAKRRDVVARATYSIHEVSPFDVLDIAPQQRQRKWEPPPTPGMLMALRREGVPTDGIGMHSASRLLLEIRHRQAKGLCNYTTAQMLMKHGIDANVSPQEAHRIMHDLRTRKAVTA